MLSFEEGRNVRTRGLNLMFRVARFWGRSTGGGGSRSWFIGGLQSRRQYKSREAMSGDEEIILPYDLFPVMYGEQSTDQAV